MYNLIKRNILIFVTNSKKIMILVLTCLLLYLMYIASTNNHGFLYLNISGGNNNIDNIMTIVLSIIINLYFIQCAIKNYFYDFSFSPEIIFLRTKKKRWLISKYVYFFINSVVFNIIIFLFYVISVQIFQFNIFETDVFFYLIINIILKFIIELSSILLFEILGNLGIILQVIFILIPIFFKNTIFNLFYSTFYTINNIMLLSIFLFTFIIITFLINNNKFLNDIANKKV